MQLYLNNNNIHDLSYTLLDWSKLSILEVNENPLDCSCNLYNITQDLSNDITRNAQGPYCVNPRTGLAQQMFYLKSDICLLTDVSMLC